MEIYADKCTVNCHKVLAALDLVGQPYEFKNVDYFKSEQKNPENLKLNPFATLPFAVIDGKTVITESNAIMMLAADRQNAETVYPKDPLARAEVNRWLFFESSQWFASNYAYLVEYIVKPLLGAEPDEAVIAAEAPRWHKFARIIDDQLAKTKFLTGDNITLADIAVGSAVHLYEPAKLPLDEYPNLKRWIASDMVKNKSWTSTQRAVDKALWAGKKGTIETSINYTKDLKDNPPEIYFYDHEKASSVHDPGDDRQKVTMIDGWPMVDTFTLDTEGFQVERFRTHFEDYEDDAKVANDLYPEVEEFLKRTTGAKRVLIFDHTIRTQANAAKKITQESNTSQRAPVMLVHCDYTAESGPKRLKQLLPNEADDLLTRRVSFINVWKPIRNVVEERPLAMCTVSSSSEQDFMKLYLRYRDRDGENYVLRYSDKHRWVYFPRMTPDEVILLKTYESDPDVAQFVGHTAFEDPTTPANAATRESIEIRTICFY